MPIHEASEAIQRNAMRRRMERLKNGYLGNTRREIACYLHGYIVNRDSVEFFTVVNWSVSVKNTQIIL